MATRTPAPEPNDLDDLDVVFDLDTLQRPKDQGNAKPFVAHLGGRKILFTDPALLSWQQLLEIDHPVMFLRYCVSDEDRDFLRDLEIEGWAFNELIKNFHRHYKLEMPRNGDGRPRI